MAQAITSKEWRRLKKRLFVFIIVAVRISVQFKSGRRGIRKEGRKRRRGKREREEALQGGKKKKKIA